jgi:ATP-binding cassette subfamily B protein
VRQGDESDCGPAALATIALHHRRPISLQQMRELAGTDRIGTNLLGLVQAAERLGFSAKAVNGPYESLTTVTLPAVAHVRTEEGLRHFVVLYRVSKDRVVIADPGCGVRRLSRIEFCRRWTGYLLLVAPEQATGNAADGAIPSSPGRRFLGLLGHQLPILGEAFTCAVVMTALGTLTSFFIQQLVDSVLVRYEGRLLDALGVGMVLILVFRTLFGALRHYLLAHVGRKVDLALIGGYARHLLDLPLNFFEMRRAGEILSRVNDAAKVREAISGTTLTAVVDATLVFILLSVLWIYDAHLALVATAFVPALMLIAAAHHPAATHGSRRAMEDAAQFSAHLVEDVSGVETIKAFGAQPARAEEGEARLVRLVQATFTLQKLSISMNTLGLCATGLAGIVILWYGGHRVMAGALTIGQLMFFHSLLGCLLGPVERLASVSISLQNALVAVDRLYQVMDLDIEPLRAGRRVQFSGIRSAIELHQVSFRYGCRANVLDGLDLCIPAGRSLAIVGESGSGKSTLLKLLMGFYCPTEGRVLVDGIDLRDYDLASLRDRIGLVSQDSFIFNGTVHDNIALGRPGATRGEVTEAARAAGLTEFIASLPERYETLIGERGANLSGGQRQRLAIARSLLRQPQVLIFDEATSHLDTATERAIQQSLRTALAGKTVVLVAHRLSTIREADRICVLQGGRVVEEGTHGQLMGHEGRYWSLVRAQSESADGSLRPRTIGILGNGTANGLEVSHA